MKKRQRIIANNAAFWGRSHRRRDSSLIYIETFTDPVAMETNVIVDSGPPPPPGQSSIGNAVVVGGLAGHCSSQFQGPHSSVSPFVRPTSCPSCVQCQQQQQQLHDQQHHYHEIGQNQPISATINQRSQNYAANLQHCDIPANNQPPVHQPVMHLTSPCCCCGGVSAISAPLYQGQAQHRHQHSIPESDSGSQQGPRNIRANDIGRSCRGPILSSSTENLQSGCESSQYSRRKKR